MDLSNYDFIDFGCSKGGSINEAVKYLGGTSGIGIDIDPKKVKLTRDAGFQAIEQDATTFGAKHPKSVSFVTMMHFLEHLPSAGLAKKCIESAIDLSNDFVYIRQPYFDADSYLFSHGLKFYWSNWRGHSNHMTALQFHNILNPILKKEQITSFNIYGVKKVLSSDSPTIHSIDSSIDQHDFDATLHPPKKTLTFETPLYREIMVIISLNKPFTEEFFLKRFVNNNDLLFSSSSK